MGFTKESGKAGIDAAPIIACLLVIGYIRFRQQKANAGPVSLAHKGLPLPHCMQDILPSNLRKNFSYLALLAMQHYRLAFQNSFSVWTTYEIDPYHV